MMRILCTGTIGFIGPHVVGALKTSGHEVNEFSGDVRDVSTFDEGAFDAVLHMASLVDRRYWDTPELFEVNVDGTKNVMDLYSGSKMILLSSTDVESDVLSPYARSKLEAERIVLRDPDNLVIRCPSVFGAGDTHDKLVPRLFRKYLAGEDLELREGSKEYVHVRDLSLMIPELLNDEGIHRIEGVVVDNRRMDELVRSVCTSYDVKLEDVERPVHEGLRDMAFSMGVSH